MVEADRSRALDPEREGGELEASSWSNLLFFCGVGEGAGTGIGRGFNGLTFEAPTASSNFS